MYKSYWAMEFNPFTKNDKDRIKETYFNSIDFKNASARLDHLKNIKGIGLFTGFSGTGKTFSLRYFANNLNTSLYKLIYIPLSTITVLEFYKALAYGLDLEPPSKKIDIFRDIQQRIVSLAKDKKITPVVVIDELCRAPHNSSYVGYIFMRSIMGTLATIADLTFLHSA